MNIYDIVCEITNHLDGRDIDTMLCVNKLSHKTILEHRINNEVTYCNIQVWFIPLWFNYNTILINCIIPRNMISYIPDNLYLLNCEYVNDPIFRGYARHTLTTVNIMSGMNRNITSSSPIEDMKCITYATLDRKDAMRLRLCKCKGDEICDNIVSCYNFCRCVPSYILFLRRRHYFETIDIDDISITNNTLSEVIKDKIATKIVNQYYRDPVCILMIFDIHRNSEFMNKKGRTFICSLLHDIQNGIVSRVTEEAIQYMIDHIDNKLDKCDD